MNFGEEFVRTNDKGEQILVRVPPGYIAVSKEGKQRKGGQTLGPKGVKINTPDASWRLMQVDEDNTAPGPEGKKAPDLPQEDEKTADKSNSSGTEDEKEVGVSAEEEGQGAEDAGRLSFFEMVSPSTTDMLEAYIASVVEPELLEAADWELLKSPAFKQLQQKMEQGRFRLLSNGAYVQKDYLDGADYRKEGTGWKLHVALGSEDDMARGYEAISDILDELKLSHKVLRPDLIGQVDPNQSKKTITIYDDGRYNLKELALLLTSRLKNAGVQSAAPIEGDQKFSDFVYYRNDGSGSSRKYVPSREAQGNYNPLGLPDPFEEKDGKRESVLEKFGIQTDKEEPGSEVSKSDNEDEVTELVELGDALSEKEQAESVPGEGNKSTEGTLSDLDIRFDEDEEWVPAGNDLSEEEKKAVIREIFGEEPKPKPEKKKGFISRLIQRLFSRKEGPRIDFDIDIDFSDLEEKVNDQPGAGEKTDGPEVDIDVDLSDLAVDPDFSEEVSSRIKNSLRLTSGLTGPISSFVSKKDDMERRYGKEYVQTVQRNYLHSRLGLVLSSKGVRTPDLQTYLSEITSKKADGRFRYLDDLVEIYTELGYDNASANRWAMDYLKTLSDSGTQALLIGFSNVGPFEGLAYGLSYNKRTFGYGVEFIKEKETDAISSDSSKGEPGRDIELNPEIIEPIELGDPTDESIQSHIDEAKSAYEAAINSPGITTMEKMAVLGSLVTLQNNLPVINSARLMPSLRHLFYKLRMSLEKSGKPSKKVDEIASNVLDGLTVILDKFTKGAVDWEAGLPDEAEMYRDLLTNIRNLDEQKMSVGQIKALQKSLMRFATVRYLKENGITEENFTDEQFEELKNIIRNKYNLKHIINDIFVMRSGPGDCLLTDGSLEQSYARISRLGINSLEKMNFNTLAYNGVRQAEEEAPKPSVRDDEVKPLPEEESEEAPANTPGEEVKRPVTTSSGRKYVVDTSAVSSGQFDIEDEAGNLLYRVRLDEQAIPHVFVPNPDGEDKEIVLDPERYPEHEAILYELQYENKPEAYVEYLNKAVANELNRELTVEKELSGGPVGTEKVAAGEQPDEPVSEGATVTAQKEDGRRATPDTVNPAKTVPPLQEFSLEQTSPSEKKEGQAEEARTDENAVKSETAEPEPGEDEDFDLTPLTELEPVETASSDANEQANEEAPPSSPEEPEDSEKQKVVQSAQEKDGNEKVEPESGGKGVEKRRTEKPKEKSPASKKGADKPKAQEKKAPVTKKEENREEWDKSETPKSEKKEKVRASESPEKTTPPTKPKTKPKKAKEEEKASEPSIPPEQTGKDKDEEIIEREGKKYRLNRDNLFRLKDVLSSVGVGKNFNKYKTIEEVPEEEWSQIEKELLSRSRKGALNPEWFTEI